MAFHGSLGSRCCSSGRAPGPNRRAFPASSTTAAGLALASRTAAVAGLGLLTTGVCPVVAKPGDEPGSGSEPRQVHLKNATLVIPASGSVFSSSGPSSGSLGRGSSEAIPYGCCGVTAEEKRGLGRQGCQYHCREAASIK